MDKDTTLVVIDVQVGLIEKGAYRADDLLARIGGLLERARGAAPADSHFACSPRCGNPSGPFSPGVARGSHATDA